MKLKDCLLKEAELVKVHPFMKSSKDSLCLGCSKRTAEAQLSSPELKAYIEEQVKAMSINSKPERLV